MLRARTSYILCLSVLLTSCSLSDPFENGGEEEMNVQLMLSAGQQASTRMAYAETQAGGSFLGIQEMLLIPFATAGEISSGDTRQNHPIQVGEFNDLVGNNNSKLFSMIPVPKGTASYLVYAKAASQTTGDIERDVEGTQAGDITFSPATFDVNTAKGEALAAYLTTIANTTGWSGDTGGLLQLRNQLLQLHAGSSLSVRAVLQQLYDQLSGRADALSTAIKGNILSSGVTLSGVNLVFPEALLNYPSEEGMPDGAAAIEWVDNQFKVSNSLTYSSLNVAKLDAYAHPAPLYYRTNSQIATDANDKTSVYTSSYNWDWSEHASNGGVGEKEASILGNYTTYGGVVNSQTKSVAIIKPLQYAVARLDIRVVSEASSLADDNGTLIEVTDTKFPIRGVLVAGQYAVGYDFAPRADATKEYILYDSQVQSSAGSTVYLQFRTLDVATPFYTLAFEGKAATAAADFVNVAVELENQSGQDFLGKDGGLIPQGGKFYLVGQLSPYEKTTYGRKAFVQDHVTEIRLKVNSLRNAYNVIPDLRKQNLEIGLTVEDWILSTPSAIAL